MAESEVHFRTMHDAKGSAPINLINKNRTTTEDVLQM